MHTTQFSTSELHAAFYRAANHIEGNPESYYMGNCWSSSLPRVGCLLIHVGAQMGMTGDYNAKDVAAALCMKENFTCANDLFGFLNRLEGRTASNMMGECRWIMDAGIAASGLRKYADSVYPAVASRALVSFERCEWRESALAKLKDIAVEA